MLGLLLNRTATGAVQLIGTANATWYITGVQLEVGEQATAFEHRSFGDELAKCQRYFTTWEGGWSGVSEGAKLSSNIACFISLFHMRSTPSVTRTGGTSTTRYPSSNFGAILTNSRGFTCRITATSAEGNESWQAIGTADAEL